MYTIDRFEKNIAVLIDEYGKGKNICRNNISGDAREGDVVTATHKENVFVTDKMETEKRKLKLAEKINKLWT